MLPTSKCVAIPASVNARRIYNRGRQFFQRTVSTSAPTSFAEDLQQPSPKPLFHRESPYSSNLDKLFPCTMKDAFKTMGYGKRPSADPIKALESTLPNWTVKERNSEILVVHYKETFRLLLTWGVTACAESEIRNIVLVSLETEEGCRTFMQGLLDSLNLPEIFGKVRGETGLLEAIARLSSEHLKNLDGLLQETRSLEKKFDVYQKSAYRGPDGKMGGLIKITQEMVEEIVSRQPARMGLLTRVCEALNRLCDQEL